MLINLKVRNLYRSYIRTFSWKIFVDKLKDTYLIRHMRQKTFPKFPVSLSIELSSYCDNKCGFCPSHVPDALNRGFGYMPFNIFKSIIDESIKYGKRRKIFLYKDGESLLNHEFGKMIRYAKKMKAADLLLITTNGIRLNEKNAKTIIESGLDELMISIDANDKNTYLNIKNTDTFDKVVRNTENFFKLRDTLKSKTPYTRVKLVVCDQNKEQVKDFIERWKYIADEVFIVKDLNTWDGSSDSVNEFVGESDSYLKINKQNKGKITYYPCDRLWYQFEINYDGTACPCVCDWNSIYTLGNVSKQSIYSMWHGEKLLALRAAHLDDKQKETELCATCDRWMNRNMGDWMKKNSKRALAIYPEREII